MVIENNKIAKRVYLGDCAGNRLVGRLVKSWIDTKKGCFKKGGLDARQAKRMAHDRSVWFVRGNGWDVAHGMNP